MIPSDGPSNLKLSKFLRLLNLPSVPKAPPGQMEILMTRFKWSELASRLLYILGLLAQPLVGLAFWTRTWDDSAITLGYARTFALTGRIEPTPGSGIVEGYSTTLWMLLMALIAKLAISPGALLVAAKISTILLNIMNVSLVRRVVALWQREPLPLLIAGVFGLSRITSHETINAMEGPLSLTLLLVAVLALQRRGAGPRMLLCGTGALFVLTRWEAAWLLVPLFFVIVFANRVRDAVLMAAAWGSTFILSNVVRWQYFGALLPNTILAKNGPPYRGATPQLELQRHIDCFAALFLALLPLLTLLFYVVVRRAAPLLSFLHSAREHATIQSPFKLLSRWLRVRQDVLLSGSLVLFALVLGAIVGINWGPPNRSFFPVWPFLLYLILVPAWRLADSQALRTQLSLALLVIMSLTLVQTSMRMSRPTAPEYMPFITIDTIGHLVPPIEQVRAAAGRDDLLFAGADMGAILLYANNVRVIDLGLLCNAYLARVRYPGVHKYIFEAQRPHLMEIHSYWGDLTGINTDPALYQDYRLLFAGGIRFFVRNDVLGAIPSNRLTTGTFDSSGRSAAYAMDVMPYPDYTRSDYEVNRRFGVYYVLIPGSGGL
jgi:hypothetical protein